MRVSLRRSGGFTNLPLSATFDTDTLPAGRDLEALVSQADFFSLPSEIRAGLGADLYQYDITVESDGCSHTVRADDGAGPPALQALIDWLVDHAPA